MSILGLVASLITIGVVCLSPHRSAAQNASLYYSHKASTDTSANARLSYLLSGERTGNGPRDRHSGQPPLLHVPRGSKTCFQIEDSNLLLYDYAIHSKAITIAAPEGYDAILTALGAMVRIPTLTPASRNFAQKDANLHAYREAINGIIAAGNALDSLKNISDADSINYSAADRAKTQADNRNNTANLLFNKDSTDDAIRALRPTQERAWLTANALYKEFSEARAVGAPQYCVDIKDTPVHITLKSTRKTPSEQRLRPIGDIVQVDVEPVNDKQFEILPVGIITFAVPGAKTFYLDAAKKVQERPDKGAYFPSAGALASFRLTRLVWVGAAAAKGQSATPDSFVGFLFRNPSIARFFVLGVGAGFASVPTDLQGGATINGDLPPGADLSKVIKKSTHVGLSIVVAMTGLSLSK